MRGQQGRHAALPQLREDALRGQRAVECVEVNTRRIIGEFSFHRSGLRLVFHHGRLQAVEAWTPTPDERGSAAFPDLTFLQLLFGYRTLDDLRYAFADCWVENYATHALLEALFPRQDSDVWPIA